MFCLYLRVYYNSNNKLRSVLDLSVKSFCKRNFPKTAAQKFTELCRYQRYNVFMFIFAESFGFWESFTFIKLSIMLTLPFIICGIVNVIYYLWHCEWESCYLLLYQYTSIFESTSIGESYKY